MLASLPIGTSRNVLENVSVESLSEGDQQGLYLETGLKLENFWVNWVSKNPLLGETTVNLLKIYLKAKIL